MFDCVYPDKLKQFVMVEYPGRVKNVDKALDTIGGLKKLSQVVNSEKDRLQLRFRPADILAHPAYGDRYSTKGIVIKITKVAKPHAHNTRKSSEHDGGKAKYVINLIGVVKTTFRFETLAEFQWLPMIRTNMKTPKVSEQKTGSAIIKVERTRESLNPEYKSILRDSLPVKNPIDGKLRTLDADCPILVLPAVFSRFDGPRESLHQAPKFRNKEMREEFERQQKLRIIGKTRKKRSTLSYRLNFPDQVPLGPNEKLVKERNPETMSKVEKKLLPKLRESFEVQKVWSKTSLCYSLSCSGQDIKYILPLVAFHYVTGPFRTMWVAYGYNPHKDKSSKLLQTLDFRAKHAGLLDDGSNWQYSKRSVHQYQLPLRKGSSISKKLRPTDLKQSFEEFNQSRILPIESSINTSVQTKDVSMDVCSGTDESAGPARIEHSEDTRTVDEEHSVVAIAEGPAKSGSKATTDIVIADANVESQVGYDSEKIEDDDYLLLLNEKYDEDALDDKLALPGPITEDMFTFREDLKPAARQMSYHLKDIHLQEVKDILNDCEGQEPKECSEKDGWLPVGTIDKIRKVMNASLARNFGKLSDKMLEQVNMEELLLYDED